VPQFIDIPTEQTTAITDVLLALLALACVIYLVRMGRARDRTKTAIWSTGFGLLAFSAALGAVAHGFKMSPRLNLALWQPLNLALGLTVGLFVVGVVYDRWGKPAARRVLPLMIAASVVFFLVTVLLPGIWLVFTAYEAAAVLFALVVYVLIAVRGRLPGAWWMAAGVLVTIVGAVVQLLENVRVTVPWGWEFDQYGLFHVIQIVGLLLLMVGLRSALLSKE
jgi:hypothetical protein